MTHAVNPVIDEADPIEEAYLLEVSSPGIERDITRDEHFAACAGERVEVRLFAPVEGSRVWTGVLGGLDEAGNVTVDVMGTPRSFPRKDIAKIRTVFEF
jgi:ribosome maturation factor RimP